MIFKDGASYEGEWFCGYAHGNGSFCHDKGETYNGQFFNNYRHGIAKRRIKMEKKIGANGSWINKRELELKNGQMAQVLAAIT